MKRRGCAPLLALTLALALALGGCGTQRSAGAGTLRIGVRADIPDFGYQNPDSGRFYGLEIDIAQALADRLGYEAEFVPDSSEANAGLLLDGTADCLIACYTITEERQADFDFSAPYYYDNTVAVVESTTGFTGLRDLRGARVGVLEGSTAPAWACWRARRRPRGRAGGLDGARPFYRCDGGGGQRFLHIGGNELL